MTTSFDSIPLIDISGLYSNDPADRTRVADKIGHVAREVGFMYVTGHHVSKSAIEGVKAAASGFFKLPMEDKMDVYIGKSTSHKGYVPEGEEVYDASSIPDHKEAFNVGAEYDPEGALMKAKLPLVGLNLWPNPSKLPRFREQVMNYYDEIVSLSKVLIRGFSLALGLGEAELDQFFTDSMAIMRLVYYPFDERAQREDSQGIGKHTDYECFTILLAESPGLEVLNGDNEWIPAPPVPDAFVINFGDLLEVMSNKQVTATAHRVKKIREERFSFPMFIGPNYQTEIKPFPQFVGGDNSSHQVAEKYASVISGEHIWASLIKTHKYLLEKVESGQLEYPQGTKERATLAPA